MERDFTFSRYKVCLIYICKMKTFEIAGLRLESTKHRQIIAIRSPMKESKLKLIFYPKVYQEVSFENIKKETVKHQSRCVVSGYDSS